VASQLVPYFQKWNDTPLVIVDTETPGLRVDAGVCDIGLARFERGVCVAALGSLINPLRPIPDEATAIHGITTEMVQGAPTIGEFFDRTDVQAILLGAQPCAYNAEFDRLRVPLDAFGDPSWPWLDIMSFTTKLDAYVKGKGRHTLGVTCARHGVDFDGDAHRALPDAIAAGKLLHVLKEKLQRDGFNTDVEAIGDWLFWSQRQRIDRSGEFHRWLAKQPPMPTQGATDVA